MKQFSYKRYYELGLEDLKNNYKDNLAGKYFKEFMQAVKDKIGKNELHPEHNIRLRINQGGIEQSRNGGEWALPKVKDLFFWYETDLLDYK